MAFSTDDLKLNIKYKDKHNGKHILIQNNEATLT